MNILSRALRSLLMRAYYWRYRVRAIRLRALALTGIAAVGKRPLVGRAVDLQIHGELSLGDDVHLDHGCSLQVGPGALLVLGNGVYVGIGTVIHATVNVEIGDRVLIGEHCSIRDSDHDLDADGRRDEAQRRNEIATPLVLGDDVWLGAGVRVLRGSHVEAASVAAANAVVRGHVPGRVLVGGVPARLLRGLGGVEGSSDG